MLVNRMKPLLINVISEEQSAFVPGRCISDNVLVAQELFHSMKKYGRARNMVAIKLDMERAYDRMRWDFLQEMMLKFGFEPLFVDMVMACVRNPNFAVLVNGSPTDWFGSSIGVRQGDPISPYLFILGVEYLVRRLKVAQSDGTISGFKVGDVSICQLLYADDCLLWCEATSDSARALKNILEEYCLASGQSINMSKSALYFGEGVQFRQKRKICRLLRINEGSLPMKYLGVKISTGRLHVSDFYPIVDRVKKRLSMWKANSLAFLGRVLLAKSVLQAISSYVLATGWVPKTILQQIDQVVRNFIWASKDNNRGMPLLNWEVVCMPKEMGGLGLRKMEQVHEALMCKQVSRVFSYSESIWSKVVRGKYSLSPRVWEWKVHTGSSRSWRSIQSGSEIFKRGLKWNIGSGYSVDILKDPWLFSYPLEWAPITTSIDAVDEGMNVVNLITSAKEWDYDKVRMVFGSDLASLILKVPISKTVSEDSLLWNGNVLAKVSVKQAYNMILERDNRILHNGVVPNLKWLWKINVGPRPKHWLWKVWNEIIQTKVFLYRRNLSIDMKCPRCKLFGEDINHMLFECGTSVLLWDCLLASMNLRIKVDSVEALWTLIQSGPGLSSSERRFMGELSVYAAWLLWKMRNNVVFNEGMDSAAGLVEKAWDHVLEYRLACRNDESFQKTTHKWSVPSGGWFKCNFDGALDITQEEAAVGVVIRDSSGCLVCAFGTVVVAGSCFEVEALAARWAIQVAKEKLARKSIIFEGDALMVVEQLRERVGEYTSPLLVDSIHVLRRDFDNVEITHIPREANQASHWVAGHAKRLRRTVMWTDEMPEELTVILNNEREAGNSDPG